jgi:glyoxylase-like metal-dependent hydrolase (beta-lactamase superfamily II)
VESWRIGSITIIRVPEQLGPSAVAPHIFFPDLDRDVIQRYREWLVPTFYSPQEDRLISSIHSWVIRTGRHTILLDSCAGNHKERPWNPRFHQLDTPYLARLAEAGVAPEDVDIVLCTHLHSDHIGWNTRLVDGRWVPTFPNARYLFSRIENDYWRLGSPRALRDPARAIAYQDSVLPVVVSGQATLLDGIHAIDDGLLVEPAPGHTPGHVVLKLDAAQGRRALFCGDVIHHPIQLYYPDWNSAYCELAEEARATRRSVLAYCADEPALLFPTHFAAPYVAGIDRKGPAFAPDFAASQKFACRTGSETGR